MFPFKNTEGIEEEISETTKKAVQKKQRKRKIVDSDQDSMTSSDDKNIQRKKDKESNSEEKDIVSNSKAEETVKKMQFDETYDRELDWYISNLSQLLLPYCT